VSLVLLAAAVAMTTFVVVVLATVLADLLYVRNRVPLTVLLAPALLSLAWWGAYGPALCCLVLAAIVTAQRDAEADRFGLVTTLLLLVTCSIAAIVPAAQVARPLPLLVLAVAVGGAMLWLRRTEIEPVPLRDQVGVLLLVLLAVW